ncbi:hypothetical protein [Luteibacter sp.]|uniref:hypothetical protein n=1 Tax=Luteibacter sp. TaxID=1886636 RepID=UPI003F7EEDCB
MAAPDDVNPFPAADAAVDLGDAHDTAMWALVMQVDARSLREAAARVGPNVWRLWDEVRTYPERYRAR